MFYYCKGVFFQSFKAKCQFLIFCVSFLNVIFWIFSISTFTFILKTLFDCVSFETSWPPKVQFCHCTNMSDCPDSKGFHNSGFLPFPTLWLSIMRLNCRLASCAKMLASDRTLSTPRTGKS